MKHGTLHMSEEDFTKTVIELAQYLGWLAVHFRPARVGRGFRTPVQGDSGSPDLLLARDGIVLLAELKAQDGYMTRKQKQWAQAIGALHRCWRPSDLPTIQEELRGLQGTTSTQVESRRADRGHRGRGRLPTVVPQQPQGRGRPGQPRSLRGVGEADQGRARPGLPVLTDEQASDKEQP